MRLSEDRARIVWVVRVVDRFEIDEKWRAAARSDVLAGGCMVTFTTSGLSCPSSQFHISGCYGPAFTHHG
jgi:hypothetical protein